MPHTISEPVQFSGIGLHSGEVSSVSVRSSQKEGIYFSTENDEYKNSFKSGCHDLTPSSTIPTSTATFEQFKKFDTINIY